MNANSMAMMSRVFGEEAAELEEVQRLAEALQRDSEQDHGRSVSDCNSLRKSSE